MTLKGRLPSHVRVVVIGAGFAGLGMAVNLRKRGIEDFLVLEKSESVGGTWRDNTYPGCACDVPSRVYSFSFAQNSQWSYSYSRQPEILSYLERVAEELGVLPAIRFSTEVTAADWDEAAQLWRLRTTRGDLTAQVVVVGGGVLAEPAMPSVPGLASFAGPAFHSARWDHDVPLAGKRIAVIGTGASAIQFVPYLQREAAHVTVFQRTAPWVLPRRNVPVSDRTKAAYRRIPGAQQAVRGLVYSQMELQLAAFVGKGRARALGERRGRQHLEKQVADPVLREALTALRPGVQADPVLRPLVPGAVLGQRDGRPSRGPRDHPDVGRRERRHGPRGRRDRARHGLPPDGDPDGPVPHRSRWAHPQRAGGRPSDRAPRHDGAGFPNLFLLLGPNTALGHSSVVMMMEAQMAYVIDALTAMADQGASSVEVRPAAQEAYNAGLQRELATTVWARGGCTAWYTNAEGHNFVIWPGSVGAFKRQMARFDAESYEMVVGRPHLETV